MTNKERRQPRARKRSGTPIPFTFINVAVAADGKLAPASRRFVPVGHIPIPLSVESSVFQFVRTDFQALEEAIRGDYRQVSPQYRRDDDIEVTTDNHRRISSRLQDICRSFPCPIRVMDVGCGTGRYFHCLTNVRELLGLDLSEEMLRAAENPVCSDRISVPDIRLVRANVYSAAFPAGSFDFIYSLGMFGNGCPLTAELCDRFYDWLTPGGKLYFNVIDTAGLALRYRMRRRTRELVYPYLSRRWQELLKTRGQRRQFYSLTRRQLASMLQETRFPEFQITSELCNSPLWEGRHLECVAARPVA